MSSSSLRRYYSRYQGEDIATKTHCNCKRPHPLKVPVGSAPAGMLNKSLEKGIGNGYWTKRPKTSPKRTKPDTRMKEREKPRPKMCNFQVEAQDKPVNPKNPKTVKEITPNGFIENKERALIKDGKHNEDMNQQREQEALLAAQREQELLAQKQAAQEKEEPPQNSDFRQLIEEMCGTKASYGAKAKTGRNDVRIA
ncbi:hypothetical protein Tco_0861819 [Tanacetum coccineum]